MDVFFLQWDMIFFRNLGMHKNRAAHDVCRSADICDRPIFIDMLLLFERFVPLRGCVGQISPSDGRCLPRAGFPSPCGDVLVKYGLSADGLLHQAELVSVPLRGCVGQIHSIQILDRVPQVRFRPLAGMCWSNLQQERNITFFILAGFRPLAGMCWSNDVC